MPARAGTTKESTWHKMQVFAREYVKDFNGARAARDAGYAPAHAPKEAYRLLMRDDVQALIRELSKKQLNRLDASLERTMTEIARVAFADVRRIFDEKGNLRPIHELDDDAAATIAGVDVEVDKDGDRTVKVRKVDKMAALALLARHHKIVGGDADGMGAAALAMAERLGRARERLRRMKP